MKCRMTLEFEFDDTGCDSHCDADWEAMRYIFKHILDDDGENPIKFMSVQYGEEIERTTENSTT